MRAVSEGRAMFPPPARAPDEGASARGIARHWARMRCLAFPRRPSSGKWWSAVFRPAAGHSQPAREHPPHPRGQPGKLPPYARHDPYVRPCFGRASCISEGEDWRRQRQTVAPAFTSRTYPADAASLARATGALIDELVAGVRRLICRLSRGCGGCSRPAENDLPPAEKLRTTTFPLEASGGKASSAFSPMPARCREPRRPRPGRAPAAGTSRALR